MSALCAIALTFAQYEQAIAAAADRERKIAAGEERRQTHRHGRISNAQSWAGKLRKLAVGESIFVPQRPSQTAHRLWHNVAGKFRSKAEGFGSRITRIA